MKNISISILKKKITYGYKDDPEMPSVKIKFIATIDGKILTCSKRMTYNPTMNDLQVEEHLKQIFK